MRQTYLLNVVVLYFFVVLFTSVFRRRALPRLKLWIAAWICAIVHFAILLWVPSSQRASEWVGMLSTDGLMLCGVCFLLSYSSLAGVRKGRLSAAGLALPCLALTACAAFPSHSIAPALAIDLIGHGIGVTLLWRFHRDRLAVTIPGTLLALACSQWSSYELLSRHDQKAVSIILMELFGMYALLFAHDFRRRSAGVWTTVAGLLAWALVFPVGMLLDARWPWIAVDPEIWNVPKVVVAFGMLVTLFEEQLMLAAREREQYRSLFDSNPLPMWIFDRDSTELLEANGVAMRVFGWRKEDLPGLLASDLMSAREISPVGLVELNWKLAADEKADQKPEGKSERERCSETDSDEAHASPMRFQTKAGVEIIVDVTLQRVKFRGREARLLVARDITEQMEVQEQLIHLANHDTLTGLPNRLLLQDRMKSAIATAMRYGTKAAVLCMDLDRFKQINDTYGHAAGDSCLREVARRLSARLRSVDTAARIGGEEFIVILDNIGELRDAERVASDLLFALSAPHIVDGHKIRMSASVGIALFPDNGEDPAELWSMADAAMYRAKQSGGNCHSFYSRTV